MKLIKPSAEYIPQEDIYKHIELCARTCYKSEDRITEDSAHKFVDGLIKAGHLAMLEHGTVYLKGAMDGSFNDTLLKHKLIPYSKANIIRMGGLPSLGVVTTNLRVLVENGLLDECKFCEPTKCHPKRYTMKFICDRGVSHELVRHRVFSFAQESQRYCNYSKDKFDKHVTFVRPTWCTDIGILPGGIAAVRELDKTNWEFIHALCDAEDTYFDLLSEGWTPQQARSVLPNATKTEIVMTGFEDDWRHFFDLRLRGTTGKPHPDMQYIAQLAWNEFKDKLGLEL